MKSMQPEWQFVTNLGDVHPIDHGGYFLYADKTGTYEPEVELLHSPDEDPDDPTRKAWMVSRWTIQNMTFVDGILSANEFHKNVPEWFAVPESRRASRPQDTTCLRNISAFMAMSDRELVSMFLSHDIRVRAMAWKAVGDYHGFINLDQYPFTLTRGEAEKRYEMEIHAEDLRIMRGEFKTFRNVWAHHPRGGRVYGFASDPFFETAHEPGEVADIRRYIAPTIEDAACMRGMSFPEEQVNPITPGLQWGNHE